MQGSMMQSVELFQCVGAADHRYSVKQSSGQKQMGTEPAVGKGCDYKAENTDDSVFEPAEVAAIEQSFSVQQEIRNRQMLVVCTENRIAGAVTDCAVDQAGNTNMDMGAASGDATRSGLGAAVAKPLGAKVVQLCKKYAETVADANPDEEPLW